MTRDTGLIMADEKPDTAENEPEELATAGDEDVLG